MPVFTQETYYFEMENCLTINCVLFRVQTLPIKRTNQSPKIKTQYKLIGKANRYFYIDLNDGFIYNNQSLPTSLSEANKNRLFRLVVQSYYAYENGRPINNLKSTSTLLIVLKRPSTDDQQVKDGRSTNFISNPLNQTIELEKYQYGDVIYRLPLDSTVRYELKSNSFALKRNQVIILRKPKRIETQLKIKRSKHNQTDLIELKIRFTSQKDNGQVFKRRLFNIQLNENATIGHQLVDLKVNENTNYSFFIHKGNQLGHFRLDKSGVLYLSHSLNCKHVDHYTLIVLANNDLKSDFAVVRIQILPPIHHLTLPILPLTHYQAVINENIPVGTKIVKIMSKNTQNLDGYRFVLLRNNQISSRPSKLFEFDSKTGYLVSTSPIDYEELFERNDDVLDFKLGLQFNNPNFYLRPFHNGSSSLTLPSKSINLLNQVSIKIKVNGEDEFYPKFEKSLYDFKLEVQPNETDIVVGQLHAEDDDQGEDGQILYSINSTVPSWTKDLFNLNTNTGLLTLNLQNNATINSWLQSSNAYTSIIVIAKGPKPNSLSSMTMVDITIQPFKSSKQIKMTNEQVPRMFVKPALTNLNSMNTNINLNKINKLNSVNKNILTSSSSYESPNELNQLKSQQQQTPTIKQSSSQQNIARTINDGYNGQRKSISNNLIQVYGIVIGLLALLLVLILFSVILLFRICNFNRKDTTSSNNSIYNSKTQSDYDPNCQLTKSMSCLIGQQNQSDSTIIIGQHNKLKQADFMINMALQRNSIIYQEQQNSGYLNGNAIKPTDASSNCNTSITIIHSHENSETQSTSDHLNSDSSLNRQRDGGLRKSRIANLSQINSSNQTPISQVHQNAIKNRPLPANPPDLVNGYQEVKYYDEVREHPSTYYSNYKELENSFNHNYEAISPAYDEQVEFFKTSWSPAYHPVTEILRDINVINSMSQNKSNMKPFVCSEQKRSTVRTATLANTNKLG